MKKRILTLALALAMCLGLAVPAFAADETTNARLITYTPDNSGILVENQTNVYQLRAINTDKEAPDYGEAQASDTCTAQILPKSEDIQLVVCDLTSGEELAFRAWSDSDNDGVYDQRFFFSEDGTWKDASVLPIPEDGVYKITGSAVDWQPMERYGFQMEDGTVTIAASRLYELFGDNTLIYMGIRDEKDDSDKGGWNLLLNGKEPTLISSIFTDVAVGQWFTDPVAWARQYGITNGTSATTFSLEDECTQLQILTFLYRAQRDDPDAAPDAADMELAQEWALQKGMIDDTFDGSKPCTRATAVNYIWQAFDKPKAEKSTFTDVAEDADYADAVNWAVAQEITNGDGSDTIFSPDKTCTRGQIVTFLYRAYTA